MTAANYTVFLDANIWISERLLKSSVGAALLYAVRRIGGKIGLPDVTEAELIWGAANDGLKAVKSIESGYTTLQTLTGSRPDCHLPTAVDFERKAKERIADLGDLIIKYDISLDQYKGALHRVVRGAPPNKTKEQFRDTLLWEAIVQAATESEIVFVTNNSDYYQGNRPERGLAQELLEEIRNRGGRIAVYPNLESYLAAIKERIPPLDYDSVANAISTVVYEDLRRYALDRNVALSSLAEYAMEAFLTERKDYLAITYELRYHAVDSNSNSETTSGLQFAVVAGKCFYHLISGAITDSSLDRIECLNQNGQRVPEKGTVYIHAGSITLGTRMIPYSVRRRLEN